MGRPQKQFDLAEVEKLAAIGCTAEEIGYFFDCSTELIRQRKHESPEFLAAYENGKAQGRMSLRHWQYQKAKDGNVTMMIWLGKQLLGQSDRQEIQHGGEVGINTMADFISEVLKSNGNGDGNPAANRITDRLSETTN